jgi:hypothetical protein
MQAKATIKKRGHRRKVAAPVGGVFVALALIGVITVVVASIRLTTGFLDNDREKRMFENIIRPVVMFNPLPFETAEAIGMEDLLRYSMWAVLTGEKRASYETGENTALVVPATDLEVAAARLFGPEIVLEHRDFGDFATTYAYDEEANIYTVPTDSSLYVYSPLVYEITGEGEFYNLLVGYIPPSNAWTTDFGDAEGEPVPEKYMIYVMQEAGDTYQIAKVQDTPPDFAQNQATAAEGEGLLTVAP